MVIGSGKESSMERQSSTSPMTSSVGSTDLVQLLSNSVLPLLHGSSASSGTSNLSKHDLNHVLRAVIAM